MSKPLNLLFLFPDQWRWDWLGFLSSAYGKVPVQTPNLDRLAQRGTVFTQCRTSSPLCAPARACLATGRQYHRCPVRRNGQDLDFTKTRTVFQRLRNAGYRTACCGKTDLIAHGKPLGIDGWSNAIGAAGFTHSDNQGGKGNAINIGREVPQDLWGSHMQQQGYWQQLVADWDLRVPGRRGVHIPTHPCPVPNEAHSDGFTATRALKFLQDWPVTSDDPWLLWVNFPGPHEPFDPPDDVADLYQGVNFPEPTDPLGPDDGNDHQAIRQAYAALCTNLDTWIGRILDTLDQRGETDRTLIIFSSDHGEMLGDHGRWWKSTWHDPSVRIPLIVAGPDVPGGETCDDLVELIDLGATLLAAAGLDPLPDADHRPLSTHGGSPRVIQRMGLDPWQAAFDGRYKLVRQEDQPDQLYDLTRDPLERENIASNCPAELQRLHAAMRT